MTGEEYINKLYKKTSSNNINYYLNKLDRINNTAIKKEKISYLKELYYKKYIIKEQNIPYNLNKKNIINIQKESLNKWLEYLINNKDYPMWAKYWIFQSIIKIGTYSEENNIYMKRNNKTISPFIELNPEIVSKIISIATKYINNENINNKDLEKLIKNGNFSKLYCLYIQKENKKNINSTDGIWIKYNYETPEEIIDKKKKKIIPEYLKLYNSLQGHNTGWCTAGDKNTAKNQICGNDIYDGGDFYVYYTKDKNNNYCIPRIAIRLEGTREIGEIRGVEIGTQNIEEGLEDIVLNKLKEIKVTNPNSVKNNMEKIRMHKYLTYLNKKQDDFTKEDIRFIYELDRDILTFGYSKDKRIRKIITKRNLIKDYNSLTDINDKANFLIKVKELDLDFICHDKDVALIAVSKDGWIIRNLSEDLKNDIQVALSAIKNRWYLFECVGDQLKKDRDFILLVVSNYGRALEYVNSIFQDDDQIVLASFNNDTSSLEFASSRLQNKYKMKRGK